MAFRTVRLDKRFAANLTVLLATDNLSVAIGLARFNARRPNRD